MLEYRDLQIMLKGDMVYVTSSGVTYIGNIQDFYNVMKWFITSYKLKTFDEFLNQKLDERKV